MKLAGVGLGVTAFALLVALPARAQEYTDTTLAPTTTAAPTTTSVQGQHGPTATTAPPDTATTVAPAPVRQTVPVSDATPKPGDTITVTAPNIGSEPSLDVSKPLAAALGAGSGTTVIAIPAPRITVAPDGSSRLEVVIPPLTPTGVYYLFIVGTDPSGRPRVLVAAIVVDGGTRVASLGGATPAETLATKQPLSVAVPDEVRALQAAMTPEREQEIVAEVLDREATFVLDGTELVVSRPRAGQAGADSRPLIAAGAVALVGGSIAIGRRAVVMAAR